MRVIIAYLLLQSCASTLFGVSFRWSESSYRIYLTGPGVGTLSDIKAALPKAPLTQIAPAIWHLKADLQVENGGTLVMHGTKLGGDINELRMKSNNTYESNNAVFISADWGNIDIRSTSITSWDDAVNGPDTECATFHRAFIRCRASLAPDGVTKQESRMDLYDSDIGYLGCHEAEAYGLVWKVLASKTNATYGDITNLYNVVNVYGDIIRCRIHHNYFGMYSFGSYGMRMLDNELDHNIGYGFDPHDDSDYLVIEGNNVHHNGTHGIIASQRCNNLIIRNNITWNNGGNGIMLHRYCDDSLVENNRCLHNGDSGISLFDTRRDTVRFNTCLYNLNSGIRFSVGASDNLVISNEFGFGGNYGIYLYKGIDAPQPGDDGRPKRNRLLNNYVHHNAGNGIFLTSADDTIFSGNLFDANNSVLWFINGRRNRIDSNSIPSEVVVRTQGNPSFLSTTMIRNQPRVPIQVDAYSATTFEDNLGRVFDTEETGIPTTMTPSGTTLNLTAADIVKTSTVFTRNLQALPDAGIALITVTVWNTSGDLNKRWLAQAGSATRTVSYKVGDLAPNTAYVVLKNGVTTKVTSDGNGNIAFQDKSVTTGVVEFIVQR